MADRELLLAPEFEALLRTWAAQPGSVLLSRPRPRRLLRLSDLETPASSAAAGLPAAQAHLVRTFRAEAAALLRQMAVSEMLTSETKNYVNGSTREESQTLQPWASDVGGRLRADWGRSGLQDAELEADLERAAGFSPMRRPSAASLAALSTRFEPTMQASLIVAGDLALRGEAGSARRLTLDLLPQCLKPAELASAWEILGVLEHQRGDFRQASEANRRAALAEPERVLPHLNRFALGWQLGDTAMVLESDEQLKERAASLDDSITDFIGGIRAQRRTGGWIPSASAESMQSRVKENLSEVGRRISDALE